MLLPRPCPATGDDITSKQLRDDLMTLLIAGHETTAAVLTWTFHCIADRPDVVAKMREEVRCAVMCLLRCACCAARTVLIEANVVCCVRFRPHTHAPQKG